MSDRCHDPATCRDPGGHVFGDPIRAHADSGPLEGDWLIRPCLHCNAFTLGPADGSNGFANVLAALAAAGCDPRPCDRGEP